MLRRGFWAAEVGLGLAQFWFLKQGSSLAPQMGFWFGRFFGSEVRGSILGPVLGSVLESVLGLFWV